MEPEDTTQENATLRDYLGILRRRKSVIVACTIVVSAAALFVSLHQEHKYRATASVLLGRQNLAASLTGDSGQAANAQLADRDIRTQAAVANSPGIAQRVTDRLEFKGIISTGRLLAESTATAEPDADLLDFSVTDPDKLLAPKLANAYAAEYTSYKRDLDTIAINRARKGVQNRMAQLRKQGGQKSALYGRLVAQDETLAQMAALQTSNAFLVHRAQGSKQVSPKPARNVALGLTTGLILGLVLALIWEALDIRVRTGDEIGERLGGISLLARITAPPRKLRTRNELVMRADPFGSHAEQFRMLRTHLDFARLDRDIRTIMVTSAVESEGKSTTVANLALAFALAGRRVVLIDLDLRRPYVARFFDTDSPGLTQVALGGAELDAALTAVPLPTGTGDGGPPATPSSAGLLEILPTGPLPPDPGEFIGTTAFGRILNTLRDRADIILIDTPPALRVGDTLALSAMVDAVLVVTRLNVVRRPMLRELRRQLDQMPARKIGFIVTGTSDEDVGYGYGYGKSNSQANDRPVEPKVQTTA